MSTDTIGAAGDYTTIAAWAAAVKAIGTLTENETGQLIDDAAYTHGANSDLAFNGVTLSGFTITLEATTNKHDGDFGNGSRVIASSTGGGVYNPRNCTIKDFSIENNSASGGGARCFLNINTVVMERVIAKCHSTGANVHCFQSVVAFNAEACRAYGGVYGISVDSNSTVVNCTVTDSDLGYENFESSTSVMRNCVAYNCTTDFDTGWTLGTYSNNASEDGSHPGTSGVTITANPFEADGYTPSNAGQLDGAGINLSISLDAAQNSFENPPAIGAYEAAAGGTTITGTGALSAQASAVAGTGEITKTGTGALSAQASAVAGTGTVSDLQAPSVTSAAINGDGDQLSINFDEWVQFGAGGNGGFALSTGETLSYFTGAGTPGLVYNITPAIVAGATVTLAYTQPGNGVEDGSNNDLQTFTGQAINNLSNLNTGTGALAAGVSAVAGTGEITKTGTGALASAVSTVAGVGTVGDVVAGTGALSAQTAALAASGTVERNGTGALAAAAAAVAGSGTVLGSATGTGAIVAEAATIAGVGLREITGTGALASGAATVSGAEIVVIYDEIELAVTITREHPLQMTVTREVST